MLKALLLENLHPDAARLLASRGIEVVTRTGALDEDELIEALAGVHIIGIRSKTQLTERVISSASSLAVIGAFCIGTNQIDLQAAANRGIAVFNAPFSNTRSVVEIAISNMISLVRRQPTFDKDMHAGIWNKSAIGAHEVRGKTLGIVGYGNIGTQLSVLAENLGMSVVFYDIAEKLALGNARKAESLDDLLKQADVVTLHVDGRKSNRGIFGEEHFAAMKPGAVFMNLSRGFVVDVDALASALQTGHLSGAAVDVFPTEPKRKGDPFTSPLQGLPNVILSPHTAGSTEEAQEAIGQFVSHKILDYLSTGSTTLSVNLPNLALEQSTGAARIAYLHRNTPGVLARVNNILAEHGENIEGQLLATRGDLGYVVTDIGSSIEPETVAALEAIEQTVRLRVLKGTTR
ncbi:phosphoglycerate dehydrogenase [Rarobacter incanus]|uniref:D-3-phosphoglycerate dehydrogenase n=1 Tax=Rarobacter incanus TaxID=153494 RepID=A0A542SLH4_9MICO|nr:phosphoglycerate dehydrogenase [Rarobacter incanus]TQK75480.1 D-3-phosphoglycerate dehydrogenase [Rarobacter incanus]